MSLIRQKPIKAVAGNLNAPAVDTAAVVTLTAIAAKGHVLQQVIYSYHGADPTAGNLIVEDGAGTTVFDIDISSEGEAFLEFSPPIKGSKNTALVVTLAAGGATVTGKLNLGHYTDDLAGSGS